MKIIKARWFLGTIILIVVPVVIDVISGWNTAYYAGFLSFLWWSYCFSTRKKKKQTTIATAQTKE